MVEAEEEQQVQQPPPQVQQVQQPPPQVQQPQPQVQQVEQPVVHENPGPGGPEDNHVVIVRHPEPPDWNQICADDLSGVAQTKVQAAYTQQSEQSFYDWVNAIEVSICPEIKPEVLKVLKLMGIASQADVAAVGEPKELVDLLSPLVPYKSDNFDDNRRLVRCRILLNTISTRCTKEERAADRSTSEASSPNTAKAVEKSDAQKLRQKFNLTWGVDRIPPAFSPGDGQVVFAARILRAAQMANVGVRASDVTTGVVGHVLGDLKPYQKGDARDSWFVYEARLATFMWSMAVAAISTPGTTTSACFLHPTSVERYLAHVVGFAKGSMVATSVHPALYTDTIARAELGTRQEWAEQTRCWDYCIARAVVPSYSKFNAARSEVSARSFTARPQEAKKPAAAPQNQRWDKKEWSGYWLGKKEWGQNTGAQNNQGGKGKRRRHNANRAWNKGGNQDGNATQTAAPATQ